MMNSTVLSPQWRTWIGENLARGCSLVALVDTMTLAGIDPLHADGALKQALTKGGQRVSTLVMYLNDVQDGGETAFPTVNLSITPKERFSRVF